MPVQPMIVTLGWWLVSVGSWICDFQTPKKKFHKPLTSYIVVVDGYQAINYAINHLPIYLPPGVIKHGLNIDYLQPNIFFRKI